MLLAIAGQSHAMQFQRIPLDDNDVLIMARGPIISGDFERLRLYASGLAPTDHVLGLAVDSPGGSVLEAEKIAQAIYGARMEVVVPGGSECTSACFLLFAAAKRRIAWADALIGVHSVSIGGEESTATMAATTLMARDAAGYDVPPAILGKMVSTPPGRTAWLTPADLALMGVIMLDDPPRAPTPPPPAVVLAPPVAAPPAYAAVVPSNPVPGVQQQSLAFRQGLSDRTAWETWLAGLSGAYRAGAEYWSGQRSIPKPGSCYGPTGQSLGDWTNGCVAAQQRLDPTDVRRKAEPDYKLGWNSF
jgi:hypothetical protein